MTGEGGWFCAVIGASPSLGGEFRLAQSLEGQYPSAKSPRLHQVPPTEEVGVFGDWIGGFYDTGHDQHANLEIDCVGVGRAAGEVAESAVWIATRKRPLRRTGDRLAALGAVLAKLTEDE